jgi:hypothetical protein
VRGSLYPSAVPLFRRRFAEVVERQLDLFAADHAGDLGAIEAARDEHRRSSVDDEAEVFGDYQDRVDWAAEDLLALRDGFATTLDEDGERDYRRAFARAAARRFPELAAAIRDDRAADEDLGL